MLRRGLSAPGLFLTLLALVAQLAYGAVVPNPDIALVLDRGATLCHSDAPAQPGTPSPAHHHQPDCLSCPLCTALAAPGIVLPGDMPSVPVARVSVFRRPGLPPPATAPPASRFLTAPPRGPPALA